MTLALILFAFTYCLMLAPASLPALCGPWRSRGLFASGAAERRLPVCF